MLFLEHKAAIDSFEISMDSFRFGIIGSSVLRFRLNVLRQITDPNQKLHNYLDNHFNIENNLNDEQENQQNTLAKDDNSKIQEKSVEDDDEGGVLHLWPAEHTGLSDWEFHKGDPDPFPSVPHGHYLSKVQPKLDAFLGHVYYHDKQIRRVTRKEIILLWNSDKFRGFAKEAIRHYFDNNPHIRDWRVVDRYKIPEKRRK